MNPYKHLESQHDEIKALLKELKQGASVDAAENQTDELVKLINTLAGKLRIHMGTEDRHLYPELSKRNEAAIKTLSQQFNTEMLGLFETFSNYKTQFNTRSKILSDPAGFAAATKNIEAQLTKRILQEDRDLYPVLRKEINHER